MDWILKLSSATLVLLAIAFAAFLEPLDSLTLVNVSYDPTREVYREIGAAFSRIHEATSGRRVELQSSHGGSGSQARAVLGGLPADVVTLALAYDVDALAERGLVDRDWQERLPSHSAPYVSTIVFLVRHGNPKGIHGWDDLVQGDVQVVTASPKTSGNGRWSFLAAWAHALHSDGEAHAFEFVRRLYRRVPVLDPGARGASATFVQKKIGDVLLAWENEALLAVKEAGTDAVEIVYPRDSILAEPPVAIVDRNVDARGSRALAEEFVHFLYTDAAQEIFARGGYRPSNPEVLARHYDAFPAIPMLTNVRELGGSWRELHAKFFADGAIFDHIFDPE